MNHSLQVYLPYFYKSCYIPESELSTQNQFIFNSISTYGLRIKYLKIPPEFFLMAPSKTITNNLDFVEFFLLHISFFFFRVQHFMWFIKTFQLL